MLILVAALVWIGASLPIGLLVGAALGRTSAQIPVVAPTDTPRHRRVTPPVAAA